MKNIFILLKKEWQDMSQQRSLLPSLIVPPLLFTLLPVVLLILFKQIPQTIARINSIALLPIPALAGLSQNESTQALLGLQFSLLYLILPLVIPDVIAAHSIVGEKRDHTLEPLLATPIKVWQVLVGKSLIAVLPAVLMTWICGGIFIAIFHSLVLSPRVFMAVITPGWLIALVFWTPILSLAVVAVITMVSARVNDPRTAQQFSAWFVVPFLLIFFGQVLGLVVLDVSFALVGLLLLIIIMIASFWCATRVFQREAILTSWK